MVEGRWKFAMFATGLLIAIILLSLFLSRSGTVVWETIATLPGTFKTSAYYGPDTLVFSNGRQFVTYNYKTGHSKTLSSDSLDANLDNIDSLRASPNRKYLAFHSQLAASGSKLEAVLRSQGLDPTQSYWWLYDVSTGAFHNFPGDVASIRLTDHFAYALYGEESSRGNITPYDISTFRPSTPVNITPSQDFYAFNNGFLLMGAGELNVPVMYTTDGIVNKSISNRVLSIANLDPSTGKGLLTRDINNDTRLVLFDIDGGSAREIAHDVDAAAGSIDNDALLAIKAPSDSKPSRLSLYNHLYNKLFSLSFKDSGFSGDGMFPLALLNDHVGLLDDTGGSIYLAGNDIVTPKQPPADYDKPVRVGGSSVEVKYFTDESAFIITLDSSAISEERAAIYSRLEKDGYNPSLLDIRFTVFTPPTTFPSE